MHPKVEGVVAAMDGSDAGEVRHGRFDCALGFLFAWWLPKPNECLRRWLQWLLCRVPFLDNTRFEYSMFGGFFATNKWIILTSPHLT